LILISPNHNVGTIARLLCLTSNSPFGQYCTALFSNPPDTSVCGKSLVETLFGTGGISIANFAYQVVKSGATPYAFIHVAGPNKGKVTKRSEDFEMLAREIDDEGISP
jgi:hypothetical protein